MFRYRATKLLTYICNSNAIMAFCHNMQDNNIVKGKKIKCAVLLLECRRGAHLPPYGHEPVGGNTTIVCDAWPVRRQTYGYLPSRKASPPIGWHQIILLGDRGTCVLTTCPGLHSTAERPGFELATYWLQVQRNFLQAAQAALPIAQPTASKHWREHYFNLLFFLI